MRDTALEEFKSGIRRVLCDHLALPAKTVVKITNQIAQEGALALDSEVASIVEACALEIPADEFGGTFI